MLPLAELLGLWGSHAQSNDALHTVWNEDLWWCQLEAQVPLNLHITGTN